MLLWQVWGDDLWTLYHKVTFDGENRQIIVNDGELDIDVQVDLYSDWKEWAATRDNLKYLPAMRSVGGDPTVGGAFLGATFFTINNWQIVLSDSTVFDGNLFSDNFDTPFITTEGAKVARSQFSNLVDSVQINVDDLITAGIATTTSIDSQTTVIESDITNQTSILSSSINNQTNTLTTAIDGIPSGVATQLNSTEYDGVPYADIMAILLSMAQGKIEEANSGVFEFYAQDNNTVLYTLTKSGNQRLRS